MSVFNLNELIRNNIKKIKPYTSARDEFEDAEADMLFVDANENPFENTLNRYPDPKQNKLRKKIAELRGVQPKQLMLGNGSDEVLDLLFRAFCEPKQDQIITMPPTYGMYAVLAELNQIQIQKVLLTPDFDIDIEKVFEAITEHTKMIFVCSPNNPTGNSLNRKSIIRLLEYFKGLVVVDEAYIDFATQQSFTALLDTYPNLVVTQTLSKAFGLAGIRLGICFASEEIIRVLDKIKPPYNINSLTQKAALEKLNDIKEVTNQVQTLLSERKVMENALKSISLIVEIYPSDANFILVKVDDADKRYKELLDLGIVVRNRTKEPHCANTLRITIGTPEENKEIVEAFSKLK